MERKNFRGEDEIIDRLGQVIIQLKRIADVLEGQPDKPAVTYPAGGYYIWIASEPLSNEEGFLWGNKVSMNGKQTTNIHITKGSSDKATLLALRAALEQLSFVYAKDTKKITIFCMEKWLENFINQGHGCFETDEDKDLADLVSSQLTEEYTVCVIRPDNAYKERSLLELTEKLYEHSQKLDKGKLGCSQSPE